MSFKITKSYKFCDGKLQVYRQSNCKNWMARFYSEGKHKVFSTKEESLHIAKQVAIEWYEKIRYEQKYLKKPVHTVKFKKVATDYLEFQKKMVSGGSLSEQQAKSYYFAINGPLKYFNNMDITEIQLKQITEFNDFRLNTVKQNSIDHDFVALRAVLKYARTRNLIEKLPEFPKKTKSKPSPRPFFELDEWNHLKDTSRKRIKGARGKRQRWEREQMHDFMIFMVHTGCRVQETLRLTYGDIKIHKKKNPKNQTDIEEIRFTIRGKTGVRPVRGMIGAVTAFRRLCKRHPDHKKTDKLFPQNHYCGISQLFKEAELKVNKDGQIRNAKSFRSTYIMYRLMQNVPIKAIATNCGTSTDVIDKYYAKYLDSTMLDDSLTNLPE